LPVLHAPPGVHVEHEPLPLQVPPEHDVPTDAYPTTWQLGLPPLQSIAPMVHALPVLQTAPALHEKQAPLPLHALPAEHVPHEPPQPSVPQARPTQFGEHTQCPDASHIWLAPQLPHVPEHPSLPHVRPAHDGAQLVTHAPAPLHTSEPEHVPHVPPQPSLPHMRPEHAGAHAHRPVASHD